MISPEKSELKNITKKGKLIIGILFVQPENVVAYIQMKKITKIGNE